MEHLESMQQLFKGELYRFSLCNKLFKKKCFDKITFPEGRIHEDLSTTYRLFANSDKAIFTNYIGYIYIKRENSILTAIFSEKRLESFFGWDEIIAFITKNYEKISNEVFSSFGFWLVDNVFYILNQVNDKDDRKRYLYFIQTYVRKHYKNLQSNPAFAFQYKLIIALLFFNVKVLIITINFKNIPKMLVSRGRKNGT